MGATYSPALQIGVPFGVRSSKEGHSCCGGCCDMVSSPQYLAYLPVLADEAAGSCKNGRILLMHDQILTQHLVFQRRATIIVNIISIIDP